MAFSLEQLQGLLGGSTDLASVLASSGQSNPAMEAVLSAIAQQRATAAHAEVESDEEDSADEAPDRIAALELRFDQLRDVARRMDAELRLLRRRNAHLAAALGACPQCWGEDPDCAVCAGEGQPGSAPPHRQHFRHYVAAVRGSATPAISPFPRAITGFPGGSQD